MQLPQQVPDARAGGLGSPPAFPVGRVSVLRRTAQPVAQESCAIDAAAACEPTIDLGAHGERSADGWDRRLSVHTQRLDNCRPQQTDGDQPRRPRVPCRYAASTTMVVLCRRNMKSQQPRRAKKIMGPSPTCIFHALRSPPRELQLPELPVSFSIHHFSFPIPFTPKCRSSSRRRENASHAPAPVRPVPCRSRRRTSR